MNYKISYVERDHYTVNVKILESVDDLQVRY